MENNTKPNKTHYIYMDILRIIACLMVIFNHTNERGFMRLAADDIGSASFFLDVLMSTVCKVGVPLFFMMSGALLIKKEEPISRTLKRIPRILIDLLLFSFVYFYVDAWLLNQEFSLKSTLTMMLSSNYWHLWYLYAYIVLLISLPVLRKMVKGLDEGSSKYLICLAFFFMGIFPILSWLSPSGINKNLNLAWLTENVFIYPILGYILENKIPEEWFTKKRIAEVWIVNIICFIISAICEYFFMLEKAAADDMGYFDERFLINFCIVNAIALYVTARYFTKNVAIGHAVSAFLAEVGKDTFGIYLLHGWFLWKIPALFAIWSRFEHTGVIGYHFGILLSCVGAFICGGIVTAVLRRIPVVKKLF